MYAINDDFTESAMAELGFFTFNFSRWHIPFATCQANIIRVLKISTAVLSLPNLGAVSCRFVRDEHCLRYERRSPLDANSSTNISVPEGLKTSIHWFIYLSITLSFIYLFLFYFQRGLFCQRTLVIKVITILFQIQTCLNCDKFLHNFKYQSL